MKKFPRNKLYFSEKAILRGISILASAKALEGPAVENFERSFASYLGVKHAIAVSSGKQALWLCLKALGVKPDAGVIVSDFNVPEVPALIEAAGMRPILVDVDPETWNMDLRHVDTCLADGARCVIATHMFGVPIRMDALVSRARHFGAVIIEDACQAVGASFGGRKIGTWGDAGFFSFGTLKIMSTLNGGMIVTDNDRTATYIRERMGHYALPSRAALLRELIKTALIKVGTTRIVFDGAVFPALSLLDGFNKDFKFSIFQGEEISRIDRLSLERMCKRMSNLQGLLGLEALPSLDAILSFLIKKALRFGEALSLAGIRTQRAPQNAHPSYFKYAVRVPERARVMAALFREGIDTTFGYMRACSLLKNFAAYSTVCPESAQLDAEHVYLPIHPCDADEDMDYIVSALRRVLGR